MIVTITINPAIDKTTVVEKLVPEKKLRCSEITIEAGGGGINVSKAIKKLGGHCMAVFPCGGSNGELLKQLLLAENIDYRPVPILASTREIFTVTELSGNAQYRFVTPGGSMKHEDLENCIKTITSIKPSPQIIVISGSLPPGVPPGFMATLAGLSKKIGAKCIIDTSGKPLQLAATEGVYLLKPNLTELCSLVGKSFLQLNEVEEAAREVIQRGHCEVIVVSMGPAGALLVTKTDHERIVAPIVKKLTTIGAGDSMVGGMAWMLLKGASLSEVVRFGVACGTAAAMNQDTGLFNKADVFKLYEWINRHDNIKSLAV